jgi:hypothetical protein
MVDPPSEYQSDHCFLGPPLRSLFSFFLTDHRISLPRVSNGHQPQGNLTCKLLPHVHRCRGLSKFLFRDQLGEWPRPFQETFLHSRRTNQRHGRLAVNFRIQVWRTGSLANRWQNCYGPDHVIVETSKE